MDNADTLQDAPWTDAELIRLFQARLNRIPYRVVAAQLGRTIDSCERAYREREDWRSALGFTDSSSSERSFEKAVEVQKLSDRIDSRLEQNRLRGDILGDRIVEAIRPFNTAPMPKLYRPRQVGKTTSTPEDVGLMLSDLHIGQKHTLEETGGLGEYSLEIYHKRLHNLKLGVRDIVELHSKLYSLPTLNLFMLGDNTHGMSGVGKWSAAYIETSIVDQVLVGVQSLAETIYYFLGMFEEIKVWCVGGNHGRAAEKGAEKDYVNWDFITYKMLATYFKDNPRVIFDVPKTWFLFPTIRNHKFLMLHGEDVKGGNYPIASLAKVEAKMAGMLKVHPDYTMIGHFHSAAELTTNHGELFINGSFLGPDMHSAKAIQAGGRPTQKLFGIHDRRGVTWRYNIDLDTVRED